MERPDPDEPAREPEEGADPAPAGDAAAPDAAEPVAAEVPGLPPEMPEPVGGETAQPPGAEAAGPPGADTPEPPSTGTTEAPGADAHEPPGAAEPPEPTTGAANGSLDAADEEVQAAAAEPDQAAAFAELEERLLAAEQRADELVAAAKRQAELADRLHAENQVLRGGEIREALAPVIRHIARIADDVARIREGRADDEDLAFLDRRLTEALEDAGVTAVRPEPGEPFDARQHQGVGTTPTEDPSADRCVAEVRRPGLTRDDGRQVRPAEVVVFRFTVSDAAPEGAST